MMFFPSPEIGKRSPKALSNSNETTGVLMRAGTKRALFRPIDQLFRTGTAVGLSDAQLLERFVVCHDEAAESAFSVLMERHGPMVLAVCRRVLNDPHAAQDAFQATFLVLVRKAGSIRKRESIADWLYGVALRVSAHARADAARRRSVERRTMPTSLDAYEAPPPDIDVRDEVEHLPRDLRAVVVLCYLEGLTHEQAAHRLGWPVGTVRSRLARARDRLRADLTRRGIAPDAALLPLLVFRASSLPEGLIDTTVKAAILLAARDAGEAGLVSASAVALTEGVLRTMLISKLKIIGSLVLAAGAISSGVGLYAYQPQPSPGSATSLAAIVKDQRFNLNELDAFAAKVEQVVKRARQEQAAGNIEKAARHLLHLEFAAGEWREALTNGRTIEMGERSPRPPQPVHSIAGSPPRHDSTTHILPDHPAAIVPDHPAAMVPDHPAAIVPDHPAEASPRGSAETRLDELERKVDQLIDAMQNSGHANTERRTQPTPSTGMPPGPRP
jgi:RNA polymerase sigma factor (sigma-70 family)